MHNMHTHTHMHTHTQGVIPTQEEAEIITRLTQEFFTLLDPDIDDVILDTAGKNIISRGAWCTVYVSGVPYMYLVCV